MERLSWLRKIFLLYINDLPDDFICDTAIYADDTTLYSKCDQASSDQASDFDSSFYKVSFFWGCSVSL